MKEVTARRRVGLTGREVSLRSRVDTSLGRNGESGSQPEFQDS